jgi:hypothetical protein
MEMTKNNKLYLAVAIAAMLAIVGVVGAASIIAAPEHITGTPLDPEPTPTPTTYTLSFSGNNTVPFYKGDTLRMTAQVSPATPGVIVTLYNNGNVVTTATTNSLGAAVFDRNPINPFDYTVTAEIP